jgi:4-hydroxy-tetrahydrodipicolinate reductase
MIATKILLIGASGRMGMAIAASISRERQVGQEISIVGGICAADDPYVGQKLALVSAPISDCWNDDFAEANVIVDFSSQLGTDQAIEIAGERKLPVLIGTTGLNEGQEQKIRDLAKVVPVLRTRNTSVGINVLAALVEDASKMLVQGFEAELVELHHRFKSDSPSGTALMLLERVAKGRGLDLKDVLTSGRSGTELSRKENEIGAQAVRGGDVAGEHTVYFFGEGERLELTHRATNRSIFADGALRGAKWLVAKKEPGYYSMIDALK